MMSKHGLCKYKTIKKMVNYEGLYVKIMIIWAATVLKNDAS